MIYTVNLFGGPGSGKSTTAAGLFSKAKLLKSKKYRNVEFELVTEFAKDTVYENRKFTMHNQLYIFAKQQHRIWRVYNYFKERNVDTGFIITDSPLLLAIVYGERSDVFNQLVVHEFKRFNPINFFIKRTKPYAPLGRLQTEEEAKEKDKELLALLKDYDFPYDTVVGDEQATDKILEIIEKFI